MGKDILLMAQAVPARQSIIDAVREESLNPCLGPLTTDVQFEAFYREYYLESLAWVHSREPSWDPFTIEDIAQNAWASILDHLGMIEQPRAYLYKTLRSKLSDERRLRRLRATHRHAAVQEDNTVGPEDSVLLSEMVSDIGEELREVFRELQRLSDPVREAYWLRVSRVNLSGIEIGEILGCSVEAAYTRIARARAQLRQRLGSERLKRFEEVTKGMMPL